MMRSCILTWWYMSLIQRPHHLFKYLRCFGPVRIFAMRGWRRPHCALACESTSEIWTRTFPMPSCLSSRLPPLQTVNHWQERRLFRDFCEFEGDLHVVARSPDFPISKKPRCLLYDCMDAWEFFANASPSVKENEISLCEQADRIWVVSKALAEKFTPAFGHKVWYVPNGVDIGHFRQAIAIRRTLQIDAPTAVYIGHIGEWFDTGLLAAVASRLPQWNFKLIGPVHLTTARAAELDRSNIELVGAQPYQALPSLLAQATVGIIPFLINDLIKATNPIKLYEYLAAGLPVVSTPMPEVVAMEVDGVIACEETAEGFARRIAQFGSAHVAEKALEIADHHSWQSRFAFGLQGLGFEYSVPEKMDHDFRSDPC